MHSMRSCLIFNISRDRKKQPTFQSLTYSRGILYCNLQSLLHHNCLPRRVFEVFFLFFCCVCKSVSEIVTPSYSTLLLTNLAALFPLSEFWHWLQEKKKLRALNTKKQTRKEIRSLASIWSFHSAQLHEDSSLFKELNISTADICPFCVAEDNLWVQCMPAAWHEINV